MKALLASLFLGLWWSSITGHSFSRRPASLEKESVALQTILEIEDHRKPKEIYLREALKHSSPRVVTAALFAMGRIGDPFFLEDLERIMRNKNPEWRKLGAFALGMIGTDEAVTILAQHAEMQRVPEVRRACLVALGRSGKEKNLAFMARVLINETNDQIVAGAAHGIGLLWAGESNGWKVPPLLISRLVDLLSGNASVNLYAAFALARFKGDPIHLPIDRIVESLKNVKPLQVRALVCRVLGKQKNSNGALALAFELLHSSSRGVKVESAKALGNQIPAAPLMDSLKSGILNSSSDVAITSLESARVWGGAAEGLTDAIEQVLKNSKSQWVRQEALKSLAKVRPLSAKKWVDEILAAPSGPMVVAAVASLTLLGTTADLDRLFTFLNHSDPKVAQAAITELSSLKVDMINAAARENLKKAAERGDVGITSVAAEAAQTHKMKELAPSLGQAYLLLKRKDDVEAKIGVLNAFATIGGKEQIRLIETALSDPERLVVEAAAKALKALTGRDSKVPLNSKVSGITPTWVEVEQALSKEVVLKTNRGEIHLRMLTVTPLTAVHFIRLIQGKFYNGKTFHRVVPNFVVQGGDPRGDGYGGPGYLIRDEVSPLTHQRGGVGVATVGKDTGGCQFYVNHAPNLHLEGRYTLFAEVTKGLEVIDQLEIGDEIVEGSIKRQANK